MLLKILIFITVLTSASLNSDAQISPSQSLQFNPWKASQLMQPATLANLIKSGKKIRIYNIGVVDDIPGAVNLGAASEKDNLVKFGEAIKKIPRNELIVVYCGCCPFDRCPNIRPAFKMLQDQKFSKGMLLNLPTNLNTDWVKKGYPLKSAMR